MSRLLLLTLLLLCSVSRAGTRVPDFTIHAEADQIITDNIGNVYLVKADMISKYDSHGAFQKSYSNKTFGPITSADATNALRIVLFYKDFNRIVFLDNTMSQNGEPVQLDALGYSTVSLAASSHDNGLWIYDQQNFELIRLDRNLKVEQRTGNLSQMLGVDIAPDFLIEKDNRLFLNNPATGIIIFDVFGTYSKTIPQKSLKNFQVIDDNIVYFIAGNLMMWNIPTSETTLFEEPSSTSALDMRMEKEAIYVLQKEEVQIYKRQ